MTETSKIEKTGRQKFAGASLVLGIISIPASFVIIGIIFGILAVIFGIVAIKGARRGSAIAGVATGGVGIVLSIIVIIVSFGSYSSVQQRASDSQLMSDASSLEMQVATQWAETGQLPSAGDLTTASLSQIKSVIGDGTPNTNTAVYKLGVGCDGTTSDRAYAITVLLESGSEYCRGS